MILGSNTVASVRGCPDTQPIIRIVCTGSRETAYRHFQDIERRYYAGTLGMADQVIVKTWWQRHQSCRCRLEVTQVTELEL
jgi:hypothetical protein